MAAFNPLAPAHTRGYHVFYRTGEVNRCPGCGRSHWYIGRLSAECGFCATALPLEAAHRGAGTFRSSGKATMIGQAA